MKGAALLACAWILWETWTPVPEGGMVWPRRPVTIEVYDTARECRRDRERLKAADLVKYTGARPSYACLPAGQKP